MNYLTAIAFWAGAFVVIGAVMWLYFTLTGWAGLPVVAQMVGFLGIVVVLVGVSTVRGWDRP